MKALLIATKEIVAAPMLSKRFPAAMLPLLDKPFIQHVVEYLTGQGVTEIEIVLCHLPEKIEKLLGDGTRWGCSISYHLVKTPEESYRPLQFMDFSGQDLLVANAATLPEICLVQNDSNRGDHTATFYCLKDAVDSGIKAVDRWSGWAMFSPSYLKGLGEYSEQAIVESLNGEQGSVQVETITTYLRVGSVRELLDSQNKIMNHEFNSLQISAREVEPQLWLSRNVELHPDVEIIPPVFIGENCQLQKGCSIGPYAVIGSKCVVSEDSTIQNSTVLSGTYIGEGLELSDSLVDRKLLLNTSVGAETIVGDNFLLGSLKRGESCGKTPGVLSRVIAAFALLIGLPFLIIMSIYYCLIKKRPLMRHVEIVGLPASEDVATWHDERIIELWPEEGRSSAEIFQYGGVSLGVYGFFTCFLPNLLNVALGKLSFVGVKPRTRAELIKMEPGWQAVVVRSRAGIISEALLRFGLFPTDDELYCAEVEYTVFASTLHDGRLLCRYVASFFGRG